MWVRRTRRHQLAWLDGITCGLYLDRVGGWRLVLARRPYWLSFSERQGLSPLPRIWHVGLVDVVLYRSGTRRVTP